MTHNRECPTCGLVVEWTKGKKREHEHMGNMIVSYDMLLICPEHGEFEPRVHEKLNRELSRVIKKVSE